MATIPLFISVPSGLEEDAAEELTRQLRPPTPLKTLQGQVLVNVDLTALGGVAATVARLLSLTTVDYVHVLLTSTALFSSGTSEGGERVRAEGDWDGGIQRAQGRRAESSRLPSNFAGYPKI